MIQTLLGEQCEPALPSVVPCRADCRYLLLTCGDGKVDAGESCDMGAGNSTAPDAACRPDCSFGRCGDRIVDGAEECDDGNRVDGDSCSMFCQMERGSPQTLPATVVDLPLQGNLACNGPSDCPTGSICSGGVCVGLPVAAPAGNTGPALVVLLGAAGASAGFAWVRRRRSR